MENGLPLVTDINTQLSAKFSRSTVSIAYITVRKQWNQIISECFLNPFVCFLSHHLWCIRRIIMFSIHDVIKSFYKQIIKLMP